MKLVPLELKYSRLLGYLVLLTGAAGALGAWPTWRLAGAEGLRSQLAAGLILLVVHLAGGAVLVRRARFGPAAVTMAFMSLSLLRVLACAVLAVGAARVLGLDKKALLVWLMLFYLVTLAGEGLWLVRSLRRDSFQTALGRICRRPHGWTLRS